MSRISNGQPVPMQVPLLGQGQESFILQPAVIQGTLHDPAIAVAIVNGKVQPIIASGSPEPVLEKAAVAILQTLIANGTLPSEAPEIAAGLAFDTFAAVGERMRQHRQDQSVGEQLATTE